MSKIKERKREKKREEREGILREKERKMQIKLTITIDQCIYLFKPFQNAQVVKKVSALQALGKLTDSKRLLAHKARCIEQVII